MIKKEYHQKNFLPVLHQPDQQREMREIKIDLPPVLSKALILIHGEICWP